MKLKNDDSMVMKWTPVGQLSSFLYQKKKSQNDIKRGLVVLAAFFDKPAGWDTL
ncbi:MAG: hypothetical protein U0W24_00670 [Bacteroidales bacterium]